MVNRSNDKFITRNVLKTQTKQWNIPGQSMPSILKAIGLSFLAIYNKKLLIMIKHTNMWIPPPNPEHILFLPVK